MKITRITYSLINLALLGLICFSCNSEQKHPKQRPNVVIILADDLGYGDLSSFGSEKVQTPEIDKLASQGVRFTNFYVPTPYCAPSRATLLTGRFPLRHGMIRNPTPDAGVDDGLNSEEITLGEVFQEAGYRTKCIGKWHLGHFEEFFPVNHGFDEYYGILYSNDMRPVQIIENRDTVMYPVDQRYLTGIYTDQALEFIDRNQKNPFFLYLAHAMPHKPLAASTDFYTPDSPDDLYQDVIRELDWSVGQLTKKLDTLGLLDNTIIIFMSDNGPWYGGSTGGLKGMKATTWEGGIRVPFIIRYPGQLNNNNIIDVPAWSPDIFPTLLAMTGIVPDTLNELDGTNILPVFEGYQNNHPPTFSMINDRIMSVRKGNYKLFINKPRFGRLPDDWVDPRGPDGTTIIAQKEQSRPTEYPGLLPEKSPREIQLFHLVDDRTESTDLSQEFPEKVKELLDEIGRFQRSFVVEDKSTEK